MSDSHVSGFRVIQVLVMKLGSDYVWFPKSFDELPQDSKRLLVFINPAFTVISWWYEGNNELETEFKDSFGFPKIFNPPVITFSIDEQVGLVNWDNRREFLEKLFRENVHLRMLLENSPGRWELGNLGRL